MGGGERTPVGWPGGGDPMGGDGEFSEADRAAARALYFYMNQSKVAPLMV